jgi:hypothetical protein
LGFQDLEGAGVITKELLKAASTYVKEFQCHWGCQFVACFFIKFPATFGNLSAPVLGVLGNSFVTALAALEKIGRISKNFRRNYFKLHFFTSRVL